MFYRVEMTEVQLCGPTWANLQSIILNNIKGKLQKAVRSGIIVSNACMYIVYIIT